MYIVRLNSLAAAALRVLFLILCICLCYGIYSKVGSEEIDIEDVSGLGFSVLLY